MALRFGRRGRKRPVLDDVIVYGFERLGQWGEPLFGQAVLKLLGVSGGETLLVRICPRSCSPMSL